MLDRPLDANIQAKSRLVKGVETDDKSNERVRLLMKVEIWTIDTSAPVEVVEAGILLCKKEDSNKLAIWLLDEYLPAKIMPVNF